MIRYHVPKYSYGTILGAGSTGCVHSEDGDTAIKDLCCIDDDMCQNELDIEKKIYQHLGSHPRICKYLGSTEHSIILKRYVGCVRGRLRALRVRGEKPAPELALRWSIQAAEGLAFLHSKKVLQADIKWSNFLLDENDELVICDFAGSSIDGCEALVAHGPWYQRPYEGTDIPCGVLDEVFAFGSALYEMWTTEEPYQHEESDVVDRRFRDNQFPEVGHLLLGEIMMKCWKVAFACLVEVVEDLYRLQGTKASIEPGRIVGLAEPHP